MITANERNASPEGNMPMMNGHVHPTDGIEMANREAGSGREIAMDQAASDHEPMAGQENRSGQEMDTSQKVAHDQGVPNGQERNSLEPNRTGPSPSLDTEQSTPVTPGTLQNPAPSTSQSMSSHQETAGAEENVVRLHNPPNASHVSESYDDITGLEYPPTLYAAMEQYLPPPLLEADRADKKLYIDKILAKYRPDGERARKHRDYKERIRQNYQPLHRELYRLDPEALFTLSFREAIAAESEESFRSILTEHALGIFSFELLQPAACSKLLEEIQHFEKWAVETKMKVMRPNTMNKYGAVLDDIGMKSMLRKLMTRFISPLSSFLFANVGGMSLDSHHGFVVEYSLNRDTELGFHVDDAEVTLNVCLGEEFEGGELFFRGVRCDSHMNGEAKPEEIVEYAHVPGRAVLHAGRHRHGARPITKGRRVNLLLWCKSSEFREVKKYQHEFSAWCGECLRAKRDRRRRLVQAKRQLAS